MANPATLADARPGDRVAIHGAWHDPYWVGTVLESDQQKKVLRVLSARHEQSRLADNAPWYNHEGQHTNKDGKVLKRVQWDIGTIVPLTPDIEQAIVYEDTLERLTGFRTWSYGLLKHATLDQVQAMIALVEAEPAAQPQP